MDFSALKKFNESDDCYGYLDCDVVTIEKYVPSRLDTPTISLAQDEMPGGGTVILFEKVYYGTLALRIPKELVTSTHIFIDGEEYTYAVSGIWDEPRYALIAGPFEEGCKVRLEVTGPKSETSVSAPPETPVQIEASVQSEAPVQAETPVQPEIHTFKPLFTNISEDSSSESVVDPALIVRGLASDNGTITYKDAFSRYLVTMEREADYVSLSVPEGYTIEADSSELISDAGIKLAVSDNLFTGYPIRIYTPGMKTFREYDFVLMQGYKLTDTSVCAVHAYTKITGAFSGEACYIIDNSGAVIETATHGSIPVGRYGIDPLTGYKWGRNNVGDMFFELEPGGYEVIATFSGPGARLIAWDETKNEKILIRESSGEAQHAGVRITDGVLKLTVADIDSQAADPSLVSLIIRALDTVAVESGYNPLAGDSEASEAPKFVFPKLEPGSSFTKPYTNPAPSFTETYPKQVKKHVDAALSSKKSRETAKTIGVAAGALALAGSIIALLTKDND